MRQMANHEMKNLSPIHSDPPSCTPQAKSIIVAASWLRGRIARQSAANAGTTAKQNTIPRTKKQL
jgi:hypothetical protein